MVSYLSPHRVRMAKIDAIRDETETVKTFTFKDALCAKAKPGQFAMVWLPGKDDIPMSLTSDPASDDPMLVIKRVGETTTELHNLKVDDVIGVRGPFGTFFRIRDEEKILAVGGGTGFTPMLNLMRRHASKKDFQIVLGAKTKSELLFYNYLERVADVIPVTEDGSLGERGQASDCVEKLMRRNHYDLVVCCGPELMIRRVFQIATDHSIPIQASLERIMKCGVGICGSCSLAGFRVCRDGPVFGAKELKTISRELGVFTRDHSGRRIPVLP